MCSNQLDFQGGPLMRYNLTTHRICAQSVTKQWTSIFGNQTDRQTNITTTMLRSL